MATRTLQAPDGTTWEVWDVQPGLQLEQRRGRGMLLPDAMAGGWLCFEGPEKRRLYPIPERWDDSPNEDLWGMCCEAQTVPPRRSAPSDTGSGKRTDAHPEGTEGTEDNRGVSVPSVPSG